MTMEQHNKIRQRSSPKSTSNEQWNTMFSVLFPDDPLPDSPYLTDRVPDDLLRCLRLASSKAPQVIRRKLTEPSNEPLRHHEEHLRSFVLAVMETTMKEALKEMSEGPNEPKREERT